MTQKDRIRIHNTAFLSLFELQELLARLARLALLAYLALVAPAGTYGTPVLTIYFSSVQLSSMDQNKLYCKVVIYI